MTYWLPASIALATTAITAPLIRRWLVRAGILDHPNARSSHSAVVPRGGGIACVLGIVAGAAVHSATGNQVPWPSLLAALAAASVGFADDRFDLPALPRLSLQIVIGACLGATMGGVAHITIGAMLAPLVINVVNFMDGINGITGQTLLMWAITASTGALLLGHPGVATIAALTAGAALGFLPWNSPRARLFLGDAGSYLFGMLAASAILMGGSRSELSVYVIAPLGIYLADVFFTLARRAIRRESLLEAHRDHVYQQLQRLSGSHLMAATIVTVLGATLAIAWIATPPPISVAATILIVLLYTWLPALLHSRAERTRYVESGKDL